MLAMTALTSSPAALRLLAVSIVARLPLAMLAIGVLVHVEHTTGSFAVAGAASGTLAVAQGAGGPLLGRLVDRRGQTAVLLLSAPASAAALAGIALLPEGAPLVALLALAAVVGFATPPVPACMRALLPGIATDPATLRSAYAVDSAAVELTWISGPPLVLMAGAIASTGTALAGAGALMLAATLAFAVQPASRAWRPQGVKAATGAMRSPGVRTLALVLAGAGLLFGATEVGVTSAADALGETAAAGPLLGLWGVGGLLGGLAAARAGGGARTGAGLAALLAGLAAAHMALAAASGSVIALSAAIVLAGTLIAPTCATAYAMVDAAAPSGTVTEAFAWMATAGALGTSAGAAAGGVVADVAGAAPTFVVAGVAALAVAAVAAARAHTLTPVAAPAVA